MDFAKPSLQNLDDIDEEEFIRILLIKICNVADSTHFAAFLYCSLNQQQIFLSHNKNLFTITPLYFQSDPTKPKVSPHFGRGIQYGVLLYLKDHLPNRQFVNHNPLQSNLFTREDFGKVAEQNTNRLFPFKKNYKVAAHFITMFASHPDHKILEIFAGSLSSLPAALLLGVNMHFVEKHSEMFHQFYDPLYLYYVERYQANKYKLAPKTNALLQVEEETPTEPTIAADPPTEPTIAADQVQNIQANAGETLKKVLKTLSKGKYVVKDDEADNTEGNEEDDKEVDEKDDEDDDESNPPDDESNPPDDESNPPDDESNPPDDESNPPDDESNPPDDEDDDESNPPDDGFVKVVGEDEQEEDKKEVDEKDATFDRGNGAEDDSNPPNPPNPKDKDEGHNTEVNAPDDFEVEGEQPLTQPITQPPPNPSSSITTPRPSRNSSRKRTHSPSNPFSKLPSVKKTKGPK